MKCLYCDREIKKYTWYSLLVEEDQLCLDCRKQLKVKAQSFKLEALKVTYFYDYDSLFKTLLLQYKECYDEALGGIFLYKIDYLIWLKYLGYQIVYVPSSKKKLEERGFNHLQLIYGSLGLKEVAGLKVKEDLVQEGQNYEARQKMKNNYYYEGPDLDKVLIVDDVCTTGASLLGVYKALKDHCKHIEAIVLAKKR